jgi:hypothetical protein
MDGARIRAWWAHRQGLDGSLRGKSAAEILQQTGWARSVGGASPYLTLFSRGRISREAADQAVARSEIHELPSARGCTYVLPAADFALGLKAGEPFGLGEMKTAYKLGVTDKEVDKLCEAVLKALAKGPRSPDEIREATGSASRNLGEEGKKKGMVTTLPLALGRLQSIGEIRRVPVNGRLDQQRYQYTLWRPNPLEKFKLSAAESNVELARRFFRWIGPATAAEFQQFAGLGVKDGKTAVEALQLSPLEPGSDRLMFADDREELLALKIPNKPQYSLIGGIDALTILRRDLTQLLDANDAGRSILRDPSAKAGGGLLDLPDHAIVDRGRIVGLWEFDVESDSVAWTSFVPKDKALEAAVTETEAYIRQQLGDARSFSLDSPKSRAPRIQVLRKAAAK